jgi:PAS domain-containing protein
VATLHEPLVILDKDYRIKSANRSFFRTFRLKAEECLVHILFELRNNAWDIPILRKAIAAARRKSGAIIEGEFSHVFPVIGKRTVCFHIQQIRAEVGTLSYVVALEDVTERKRIEKADVILKERQTFRDFFMQSNAAFCVLKGPDHIFEFANAAFCKLIGDRDPRSRKMREMLPELEAAGLYKILYHVYHTGKPYSGKGIPLSVSPEDGVRKELILNFNFQAFTDINDEVEGILVVVYDVTETTRAQRVIRESEIRYRSLISGLPIAVYTCDAQGYIRLYNKAAVELWGREPEVGKERWCGSWKLLSTGGEPLEPDRGPLAVAVKEGRIVNT